MTATHLHSRVSAPAWVLLDLARQVNNVGVTTAGATGVGGFNVWRNSLPAEELPSGREVQVCGVPYAFPEAGTGLPDNVRCEGQALTLPPGDYDWLYLLAAAERRAEDEIAFHFADGSVDFEPLRLSDFWAAPGVFGEDAAFVTRAMHYPNHVQPAVTAKVWSQRVPIVRRTGLRMLRWPDNPAVHIFAATLRRSEGGSGS